MKLESAQEKNPFATCSRDLDSADAFGQMGRRAFCAIILVFGHAQCRMLQHCLLIYHATAMLP